MIMATNTSMQRFYRFGSSVDIDVTASNRVLEEVNDKIINVKGSPSANRYLTINARAGADYYINNETGYRVYIGSAYVEPGSAAAVFYNGTTWIAVSGSGGSAEFDIHALTSKTSPVDNDEIPIADSEDSYAPKKIPLSEIKTSLATLSGDVTGTPGGTSISRIKGYVVNVTEEPPEGSALIFTSSTGQWEPIPVPDSAYLSSIVSLLLAFYEGSSRGTTGLLAAPTVASETVSVQKIMLSTGKAYFDSASVSSLSYDAFYTSTANPVFLSVDQSATWTQTALDGASDVTTINSLASNILRIGSFRSVSRYPLGSPQTYETLFDQHDYYVFDKGDGRSFFSKQLTDVKLEYAGGTYTASYKLGLKEIKTSSSWKVCFYTAGNGWLKSQENLNAISQSTILVSGTPPPSLKYFAVHLFAHPSGPIAITGHYIATRDTLSESMYYAANSLRLTIDSALYGETSLGTLTTNLKHIGTIICYTSNVGAITPQQLPGGAYWFMPVSNDFNLTPLPHGEPTTGYQLPSGVSVGWMYLPFYNSVANVLLTARICSHSETGSTPAYCIHAPFRASGIQASGKQLVISVPKANGSAGVINGTYELKVNNITGGSYALYYAKYVISVDGAGNISNVLVSSSGSSPFSAPTTAIVGNYAQITFTTSSSITARSVEGILEIQVYDQTSP